MTLKLSSSSPKFSKFPSELSKAIAQFVLKEGETNYESIRNRFDGFEERLIKKALNEATLRDPALIQYDRDRMLYQASALFASYFRLQTL